MKSFIPFIIIGVCAGMFFVYMKPTYSKISERKMKYEEYETVLNKVKEIKDKRDALSAKYNSVSQEDLDKLTKMIPEKLVPEYFANDLNAMASRNGMRISQIDVSAPQTVPEGVTQEAPIGGDKFVPTTARFTVSGRYEQFVTFLKELESSLRLMDVTAVSIKSAGANKDRPSDITLSYSLEVRTYSVK